MGLDTSHGAFNGSYMAFDLLRDAICAACGDGSYPPHSQDFMIQYFTEHAEDPDPEFWYWEGDDYSKESHPGLYALLCHSDCDGEIDPDTCEKIADEMVPLVDKIEEYGQSHGRGPHLKKKAETFIAGCREAHMKREPLLFR